MINKKPDRPVEQEAITTTIVGGRPPGCGQPVGMVPRGIEVLVKKAAVDPAFRARLLTERTKAADEIGLRLEPSEVMMLNAVPAAQLERIIANTRVKPEHRGVFLGKVAAMMLMAIGMQTLSCDCDNVGSTRGVQPDRPPEQKTESSELLTKGIRPDRPQQMEKDAPQNQPGERSERIVLGIRPDRPQEGE
jgi:hypothetical protein